MIQTKDDLIQHFNNIIGDNTDDNVLAFLEDINDTFDDFETKTQDNTNWKQKYEENDNEWRNKYKERFMSNVETEPDLDESEPEYRKPMTFEDLFREE